MAPDSNSLTRSVADQSIRVVCGLGNPGPEYAHTRHNIGFLVVDRLAAKIGTRMSRRECQALTSGLVPAWGRPLVLLKPQTYMNLSGQAVGAAASRYGIAAAETLVVHDDADLPFGRIRIRMSGSSGGHRGLKSIAEELGTEEFPRLRLGVSNEQRRDVDLMEFVLEPFAPDEEARLDAFVDAAVDAVECALRAGLVRAMNLYNRRTDPEGTDPGQESS